VGKRNPGHRPLLWDVVCAGDSLGQMPQTEQKGSLDSSEFQKDSSQLFCGFRENSVVRRANNPKSGLGKTKTAQNPELYHFT